MTAVCGGFDASPKWFQLRRAANTVSDVDGGLLSGRVVCAEDR